MSATTHPVTLPPSLPPLPSNIALPEATWAAARRGGSEGGRKGGKRRTLISMDPVSNSAALATCEYMYKYREM